MQKFDYIISGAGIAGVTLAHHLLAQKKRIIIFDVGSNTSSRIAPGLFNPITGRKMVKTWRADNLFPYLEDYYSKIEKVTGNKFLHKTPIYRPFISVEEQNDWAGKSGDDSYKYFVKEIFSKSQFPEYYNDPYGGILLDHSGWLDVSQYLDVSLRYFQRDNDQINVVFERLDPGDLIQKGKSLTYKNIEAGNIVFCEGGNLKNNHFFNWLPLQLLKGEILEVKLPFTSNNTFNRGIYILPVDQNRYKVGSTYVHNDLSPEVSDKGRQQLEEKLRALIKTGYKVIDQYAGIRPTTKDRRPFLGVHPEFSNMFVFNGLGTKGVSIGPYFANEMTNFLLKGNDLPHEVNIKRFLSLYKK